MSGKTDAELSMAEGILRAAIHQGHTEFAGDPSFLADVIAELRRLRSGKDIVMPSSVEHAEAMHLLAESYLKANRK